MDNDKTVALLTEIRDLQQKSNDAALDWAKQSVAQQKEQREWVLARVIVPAYALLVILILVELTRR